MKQVPLSIALLLYLPASAFQTGSDGMVSIKPVGNSSLVSRNKILKVVVAIIEKRPGLGKIAKKPLSSNTQLVRDLGADSLDIVEFVMAIEEHYKIKIEDAELDSIKAIGDLVDLVLKRRPNNT